MEPIYQARQLPARRWTWAVRRTPIRCGAADNCRGGYEGMTRSGQQLGSAVFVTAESHYWASVAHAAEFKHQKLRQEKKQNAEDDINGEKLDAFDPVGFAVAADLKQDVNRSDYGEDFRPRKLEVHRVAKQIGDE